MVTTISNKLRATIWTLIFLLALVLALPMIGFAQPARDCSIYTDTGKEVCGRFLQYWEENGGLAQQGLPISDEMQERSETDGKVYTVQYFERAVFELHPENSQPYDVLLSLLGNFYYKQKYPSGAPGQTPNNEAGSVLVPQTGKRLGGVFLSYWRDHGGLAQQGYPISDEFMEVSDLDGKRYRVQYFERAVFEYHPENAPPNNVLLSQLGTFRYRALYQSGGRATPTVAGGKECEPTVFMTVSTGPRETAPLRSSVGTGHVMSGVVRSSDCSPIAGASIVLWLTNPQGQYDDAHRAMVVSDRNGAYRFESNFPGTYQGAPPHIHFQVWADGYWDMIGEVFLTPGQTQAAVDMVLPPRTR
jgi:hypothetical protein